MRNLYPEIEPYKIHNLKVSELHTLYVEESGNPNGRPIIHLHGGPGYWSNPKKRRFYNPEKYRIILFDQRGCGKSTPQGEIKENTTWDLVEDMEKIRNYLGIEKWHIFGGSWGSCLALCYAEKHPERVSALIIQGILTYRQSEIDWLTKFKAKEFFPDIYENIVGSIPDTEKSDPMKFIQEKIINGAKEESEKFAELFETWDQNVGELIHENEISEEKKENQEVDNQALINSNIIFEHYDKNKGFLREGQIFEELENIRKVPAVIIQGRYDMVCTMRTAWDLHKAWPEATLEIVHLAGHASSEPGNIDKILEYTDKFADL